MRSLITQSCSLQAPFWRVMTQEYESQYNRSIPEDQKHQWRFLPQFCFRHMVELREMGGPMKMYVRYLKSTTPPCNVDGCTDRARWQERYRSMRNMGG